MMGVVVSSRTSRTIEDVFEDIMNIWTCKNKILSFNKNENKSYMYYKIKRSGKHITYKLDDVADKHAI